MFANTRRRSFRSLSPMVDGLEGRQMLTSLSFAATVATPLDIKKTAPTVDIKHVPTRSVETVGNHGVSPQIIAIL